jgi:hypothetical protein
MDLGCNGALPSFPYARLVPADIPICVYFRHGKIMHNDDFAIIENGHEGTYICSSITVQGRTCQAGTGRSQ